MKILFVTDLYPINDENKAKALKYFVLEWIKQGHCVDVIRPNFLFNSFVRKHKIFDEKIYFEDGVKIYNLNFYTPFLFDVYKKLPKDFSLKNYDVIISHLPCGAIMSNKLLKKDKIKYICSVHASDIVVLTSTLYCVYFKKQLMTSYKNAYKISARSPILKEKIEKILNYTKNKTFVALSGVEEKFFNYEKTIFNKEKLNIVTVSSLIKRKNIDVIIKSLSNFKYDFNLTIIGDGDERKNLEKLSQKLKIENITFTGKIKRDEVINYLKKSDIFVLLSDNETFGLSYLEALATKNIVIAKKNDGIDGIIKNNFNGFLINSKVKDLQNCLEKIINLKESEIEEIRNNAYKTAFNLTSQKASKLYLENIQ
jgi:glycosyltransferase involved in cell wall biosynthesis